MEDESRGEEGGDIQAGPNLEEKEHPWKAGHPTTVISRYLCHDYYRTAVILRCLSHYGDPMVVITRWINNDGYHKTVTLYITAADSFHDGITNNER